MMKINLRWPVVLLAFFFTIACIYAVNYWRQQRLVEEPLKESLLNIEGVEEVKIVNNADNIDFLVSLREVENLAKTYSLIEEALKARYKENTYNIILKDKRDPYLEALYAKVHFALMEGERRGNYSKMSKEVSLLLDQEKDLNNYRLWVDQKRIYLQISAQNHYLYEVIPLNISGERGI